MMNTLFKILAALYKGAAFILGVEDHEEGREQQQLIDAQAAIKIEEQEKIDAKNNNALSNAQLADRLRDK